MTQSFSATVAILTLGSAFLTPLVAQAQTLISGDQSIDGRVCIGRMCSTPEDLSSTGALKLKQGQGLRLYAEDTTDPAVGPHHHYSLRFGSNTDYASGGEDYFQVWNETYNSPMMTLYSPVEVPGLGNTPPSIMTLGSNGHLGVGTQMPTDTLHLYDLFTPGIKYEFSHGEYWQTYAASGERFVFKFYEPVWGHNDTETENLPVWFNGQAPDRALYMEDDVFRINNARLGYGFQVVRNSDDGDSDYGPHFGDEIVFDVTSDTGRVGIGRDAPEQMLHLWSDQGEAAMLIEETSAGTLGQLTLRNNGITFFTLEDTSIPEGDNTGRLWNFQNQAGTFRVTTAPGGPGEIEMQIDAAGDMYIKGQLYTGTGGATTTCVAGCDAVFDEDYELPSLSDHMAAIRAVGHLPAVGPTDEDGPHNLSQMVGGTLNELEKAYLYIDQLRAENAAQSAQLASQSARLAALEQAMQPHAADR